MLSIEKQILETHFACDLLACKGACCTFPGGEGAPLQSEERALLEEVYPKVKQYLPKEHLEAAERDGRYQQQGMNFTVTCYRDAACVFVMYEDGIAKCAIQHAYFKGEVAWEKPESCHLFPIRRRGKDGNRLEMESFSECEAAFERGDKENITLVEFLDNALVRTFGAGARDEIVNMSNSKNGSR